MKRLHLLPAGHQLLNVVFFGVLVAATSAAASTNLVSQPFGFTRATLLPGETRLISTPFLPPDDSIDAVLEAQLTGSDKEEEGDVILKWNSTVPEYLRATKADKTGDPEKDGKWFESFDTWIPSDFRLNPGEGFFVVNKQTATQDVWLAGLVVSETQVEIDFPGSSVSLFGYPFPAGIGAGESGLSSAGRIADGLGNEVKHLEIGGGYWCFREALDSLVWKGTCPYLLTSPTPNTPPRIQGLMPAVDGRSVALRIRAAGVEGERLDVYCQDLGPTNILRGEAAWQVLALDLDPAGSEEVTWLDVLPKESPTTRVYLIGNAMIDADGDGIPDCRQKYLNAMELARIAAKGVGRSGAEVGPSDPVSPGSGSGRTVYVDKRQGSDLWSGRVSVVALDRRNGPKKSVRSGLSEARAGDTLVIRGGQYGEPLNVAGKGVAVKIEGHVNLTK